MSAAPLVPSPIATPAASPVRSVTTPHASAARVALGRTPATTPPTLPPAPHLTAAPVPSAAAAAPETGGPKILSVTTDPSVVHTGESVTWTVRTSADVVSVTAHVSAYTLPLQQQHPGQFFLGFTIPSSVPAIFHGTYTLELTARSQSGASATRSVPMVFQ